MKLKINTVTLRWIGIGFVGLFTTLTILNIHVRSPVDPENFPTEPLNENKDENADTDFPLLEQTKEDIAINQEIGDARYKFIYKYPVLNADGSVRALDGLDIEVTPFLDAKNPPDQNPKTLLLKLYARIRMGENDGIIDPAAAGIIIDTIYKMDEVIERQNKAAPLSLLQSQTLHRFSALQMRR